MAGPGRSGPTRKANLTRTRRHTSSLERSDRRRLVPGGAAGGASAASTPNLDSALALNGVWNRLSVDRSNPAPEHESLACDGFIIWRCFYFKIPEPALNFYWNTNPGLFPGNGRHGRLDLPSVVPGRYLREHRASRPRHDCVRRSRSPSAVQRRCGPDRQRSRLQPEAQLLLGGPIRLPMVQDLRAGSRSEPDASAVRWGELGAAGLRERSLSVRQEPRCSRLLPRFLRAGVGAEAPEVALRIPDGEATRPVLLVA
jgi:hypothetical protein